MAAPRVAVVGGGIAGLAAALRLRSMLPSKNIVLYESRTRLGGKLHTGTVAGGMVETGAEAFLMRDPAGGDSAAVLLAREVGLGDAIVHPEPVPPAVYADGEMRPVPKGTLLGVPSDLSMVEHLARAAADADPDLGRPLLAPRQDVAVGALVRARLGDRVVDRLVDPMLGGVYAGRADNLSLEATMPALARECRIQSTLLGAVRSAIASSAAHSGGPVFGTIHGGLSRVVDAVVSRLDGVDLRLGSPVRELAPGPAGGWRLVSGPVPAPRVDEVDAVVVAVPAAPAARLLGTAIDLDYASVGLITLALPPVVLPALSGFLVPATEGFTVKAATIFSTKWAHQRRADGTVIMRASVGRHGDSGVLALTDPDLIGLVRRELSTLLDLRLPDPVAATVIRWGGALPQYSPGHVARVALLRAALPQTLAVAGAAYDGIGIPACVRSGWAAAATIVKQWAV